MKNEILSIGPLTVSGYGLMISIGVLFAVIVALKRCKNTKIDEENIYDIAILSLIGGFLSAKLLYCIIEYKAVLENPMLFFSGSGFVVYGGIIGGVLSALVYCKIKKINFLEMFDLVIPSVAIAQGFGRIGCFMAGCCYGRETSCSIGVTFNHSPYAPNGVKLLPTQLFSSAGDFVIAIALIIFARTNKKSGRVGALYMILYSIGRFIIEYFRNDYRGSIGKYLSTSQFISIFILIIGLIIFFKVKNTNEEVEEVKEEVEKDEVEEVKEEVEIDEAEEVVNNEVKDKNNQEID